MARRGLATALQAALAGFGGYGQGVIAQREREQKRLREEEETKRQRVVQAVTLAASGVRPRQPSPLTTPTTSAAPKIGAVEEPKTATPQTQGGEQPSAFMPIPGFPEYEMGPTPSELRAESARLAKAREDEQQFERTNRSRFNLLQREGYFPKELSYEDMKDTDLSSDFQTFLQGRRDEEAYRRAQLRPDYGEPLAIVSTPEGGVQYVTRSQAVGKAPGAAGGETAGGARSSAQVNTAINTAKSADERMTKFEDKILAGKTEINPWAATLARRAYGTGADAAVAESILNKNYPEIAEYVRDAKAIGVSERLITPRGGSNYLTQTEIALAGAGPNASARQVIQARSYRQSLVQGLSAHQAGAPPASSGDTRTQDQRDWDDAVAKYGVERVTREYGPRPQ